MEFLLKIPKRKISINQFKGMLGNKKEFYYLILTDLNEKKVKLNIHFARQRDPDKEEYWLRVDFYDPEVSTEDGNEYNYEIVYFLTPEELLQYLFDKKYLNKEDILLEE